MFNKVYAPKVEINSLEPCTTQTIYPLCWKSKGQQSVH